MLLLAVLLVVAPALIYYICTTRFYRKANSEALGKRPPTIPYLVPGVSHAFSLAYDGPQKYFAKLLKNYGDFAPFAIKAGLRSFVVLRDANHIAAVARASKQMTSPSAEARMYGRIFGVPRIDLNLSGDDENDTKKKETLEDARITLTRKYLTGRPLATTAENYASILSRDLNDKMFQVGSWTQIEDMWSFFQQVITRAMVESLFGSAMFRQYPGVTKDLWKFEDAIQSLVPGMPRLLMSAAHNEPRNRLRVGIRQWLRANHSGSEFARVGDEDPDLDDHKGSKFIQERDYVLAKVPDMDFDARSAEMFDLLHSACSTVVPTAIWTMIEILRKPQLVKHLKSEVSRLRQSEHLTTEVSRPRPSDATKYNVDGVVNMPMFQSINQEVTRLRTAQYMTYTDESKDMPLDDQWRLPSGYTAICFSHDVALNTQIWEKGQPQTIREPLEEFWAERFLITHRPTLRAKTSHQSLHNSEAGSFDVKGQELLALAFDERQHLGFGGEYAKAMQAATLSVLLSEFEIELCSPGAAEAAMPELREVAFGAVRPLDPIAVRIRKRRTL